MDFVWYHGTLMEPSMAVATILPFPLPKLATVETSPFALIDFNVTRSGSARVIRLSDYRIRYATPEKPTQGWIVGGPFNMNLCLE